MATKQDILAALNDEQQEVAVHSQGPCFVIAGPGGGKTHTLVSRTQCMILDGIDARQIVLFTFTNKAANEIKERVKNKIGDKAEGMTIGTYHSVCNRFLRKNAQAIGFNNNFSILMPEDCDKIIKQISKRNNIEPEILSTAIDNFKNKAIFPNKAILNAENDYQRGIASMYQDYQDELFRQQAMDFDDLLLNTIKILENNPEIKAKTNKQWKYIIADEFHDSSRTDLRLMKLLAGESENICMILDDNQSIYGFRGADIEAVMNSVNIFKEPKIFNLSRNYRSSQTIVNASKSLIAKNKNQMKKVIRPARDYEGSPIIISKAKNIAQEAVKAVSYVKLMNRKYNIPYNEMAILYRMSFLSRTLEQAFVKADIPYQIIGGTPFFTRMEIQDILSFVKLTINEFDVMAFKRTIQIPKRGIGDTTIDKIDEYARTYPGGPISIREAIKSIDLTTKTGKETKASIALAEYVEFLEDLDQKKLELTPDKFIEYIVTKLHYLEYLESTKKSRKEEDIQSRIENLMELVNVAKEYKDIEELLIQASLFSVDEDNEHNKERVQFMTMHASKGLEFKVVIMIGMCEGTSPHYKAKDEKQLEEERRLAYVAVTRAEDYLFMTYPEVTMVQGKQTFAKPSRFLREIDKKYVHVS